MQQAYGDHDSLTNAKNILIQHDETYMYPHNLCSSILHVQNSTVQTHIKSRRGASKMKKMV